jgi:hypothetical protein
MALLEDIPFLKRIIDAGTTLLIVIILSVLVGLILAFPVMWLWNFVFTPMSAKLHITVFQAWALNVLAGLLFSQKTPRGK